MIRKFLVKNFVLNYKFLGLNTPRASRITFPLMVITGAFWIKPNVFSYFFLLLLAISLLIEFVYFRFCPAKYEELDEEQIEQYNIFHSQGKLSAQTSKYSNIRNIIHYFLGVTMAYTFDNYSIKNMNEIQLFVLSMIVGGVVGLLIGVAIEIYQNWFLKQKYNNLDIKRTMVGGLIGGLIYFCQSNLSLITVWFFWICIGICVLEIIRSQVVRIKLMNK
jgi:VanZ family protein